MASRILRTSKRVPFFCNLVQITHVKWGLQRFLPQNYTILYPKIRMSERKTRDHSAMLHTRVPRADKCHPVENMGTARVYAIGSQVRDFCVSTVQLKQTEFCRFTLWKYTKPCDVSWKVRVGHSQNWMDPAPGAYLASIGWFWFGREEQLGRRAKLDGSSGR